MKATPKYKLFLSAMIFAFLWVIIGDLVNMHVRVITGKDLYGHHQPFSKTHKPDKKTFKVKGKKSSDNSNSFDFSFFSEETSSIFNYRKATDFLYWFVPKFIASTNSKSDYGRAPPRS